MCIVGSKGIHSTCQERLRHLWLIILHVSSMQVELNIQWRKGPSMPFGITDYIQSVLIEKVLYVGGGWTRKRSDNNYLVLKYDTNLCLWQQLRAAYTARDFAMVAINNSLVLVGGCDHSNADTNLLGMWNSSNSEWERPYPAMPTARHNSSAIFYLHWLVVAGGLCQGPLQRVEILDVNSKQWFTVGSTPVPLHSMKSVLVGRKWYLMGGYEHGSTTKVYCISLPVLIAQATATASDSSSQDIWISIPDVGCHFSTPVCINETLYAVGGKSEDTSSSTILRYESSQGWLSAGELLSPLYNCTCVFSNGLLLVAGGICGSKSSEIFIGSKCKIICVYEV